MKIFTESGKFSVFSTTTNSALQKFLSKPIAVELIIANVVEFLSVEIPSLSLSLALSATETPVSVHFNFSVVLFLYPTSAYLWRAREKGSLDPLSLSIRLSRLSFAFAIYFSTINSFRDTPCEWQPSFCRLHTIFFIYKCKSPATISWSVFEWRFMWKDCMKI